MSFVPAISTIVVLVSCSWCRSLLHVVGSCRVVSMCLRFLFLVFFKVGVAVWVTDQMHNFPRFLLIVVLFFLLAGLRSSTFPLLGVAPVYWSLWLDLLLLPGVFVCHFQMLFSRFPVSEFSSFLFIVVFLCPVVVFLCFVRVSLYVSVVPRCPVFGFRCS